MGPGKKMSLRWLRIQRNNNDFARAIHNSLNKAQNITIMTWAMGQKSEIITNMKTA